MVDKYLGSKIPLSVADSSFIDFTVNDNKASFENRFMVVFKRTVVREITNNDHPSTASIIVYPNPVENKTVKVRFVNQASGRFTVQLINPIGQVIYNSSIKINSANTISTIKLSSSVAAGSYELIVIAPDGKETMQKIVIK